MNALGTDFSHLSFFDFRGDFWLLISRLRVAVRRKQPVGAESSALARLSFRFGDVGATFSRGSNYLVRVRFVYCSLVLGDHLMSDKYRNTPILLLVFKRPEMTRRVLAQLRAANVQTLYISSDAADSEESALGVAQVREIIVEEVDWNCSVHYNLRDENKGLREGVLSGIDWFFENETEGIILEDDCIPSPEFFDFCHTMLERFRDNPGVMHVAGDNSPNLRIPQDWSYCFIEYPHVWGWATWKSAWDLYDRDLALWQRFVSAEMIPSLFTFDDERSIWEPLLDRLWRDGIPDTWDWQWAITLKMHRGLAVQSLTNLVSNVGSGPLATHTRNLGGRENVALGRMGQLRHPDVIFPHKIASRQVFLSTQTTLGVAPPVTIKTRIRRRVDLYKRKFQA